MRLHLIATLLFLAISVSGQAQSGKTGKKDTAISIGEKVNTTLSVAENEKWSHKIKPYYNQLCNNMKAHPITLGYSNIDEKMCLLIKKNIFVDTGFRISKSLEDIDDKMVYPRKSINKPSGYINN